MPSIADVYLNLRVKSDQVRQDAEAGLKTVNVPKLTVPVDANTKPATGKVDDLRKSIASLGARAATFNVDANDKAAKAKLLDINASITKLGARVVQPGVDPQIVEASYLRASLALDKLARNRSVKIDVDTSGLSKLSGLFGSGGGGILGSLFGGGSSGAGEAGTAASASGPSGIIAGITAAIIALPFIAQVAAAGIVTAFGTGLAGMAIAGAFQSGKVKKSFSDLKDSATKDLGKIGTSFVPVMQSVLGTATGVLNQLTPVFSAASGVIAGPFKIFANTILTAFTQPSVKNSIKDVAKSFGSLLSAITPQIPGDVSQIAGGISAIAKAVSAHPQAFADFIHGLVDIASGALNIIAALTNVASWIEHNWNWFQWIVVPGIAAIAFIVAHWGTFQHQIAVIFDGVRHETAVIWNDIYGATIGVAIRIGHDVETQFNSFRHATANIFNGVRHDVATIFNNVYGDTIGVAIRIGHNVETQFNSLRHQAAVIFDGARHDIAHIWDLIYGDTIGRVIRIGKDAITGVKNNFVTPFQNAISGAWNWVIAHVWNPVKTFLGSTIGNWFGTAVTKIGQFWSGVQNIVQKPIKWVFVNVIDRLAGGFDAVTNALGLGKPIPAHVVNGWATGGRITQGTTSTADDVLARVSRDETIVSAAHSAVLAPYFAAVGVPGYAAGGTPNPSTRGRAGGKIAQGSTPGFIAAIGHAVGKAIDVGKIGAAIATGNTTALTNALTDLIGKPAYQGAGEILKIATAIPTKIIKDAAGWLLSHAASLVGAGGGSGPLGGATGSEMANGVELYEYLLKNLFGGHKIAAAGATASIWGESTWNPFAQGTGGRGLIGWTPPGTISDAAFRGGMRTQLPAILRFVTTSGDSAVIARMFQAGSVFEAANEWGVGVERFGINDVHPTGVSLATQIMNSHASGGTIWNPTYGIDSTGAMHSFAENGPERVVPAGSDPMLAELRKMNAKLDQIPMRTAAGVARAVKAPAGQEAQAARIGAR